jgi:tRNA G18 (ribose-2'-O)-methylase SpoU
MHLKANFNTIHEQHVLRHILHLVQKIDTNWQNASYRRACLKDLMDCLKRCSTHHSDLIKEQAKLLRLIKEDETSYHHFIGIFVALERAYSRGVFESDFVVETKDHANITSNKIPCVAICDNIRSAHNVGAIIRSAECFGIETLYLCGYTSTPDNEKTRKTAMGCDDFVDWQWRPHIGELIGELKAKGFHVYALETAQKSSNLFETKIKTPCAFVLGNERFGIDEKTLDLCDEIIRIPMAGVKNSLNIAAAFSIAAAECVRQIHYR